MSAATMFLSRRCSLALLIFGTVLMSGLLYMLRPGNPSHLMFWSSVVYVTPSLQSLPMPSGSQTFVQGQVSLPLVVEEPPLDMFVGEETKLAPDSKEPSAGLFDGEDDAETDRSLFQRAKEIIVSSVILETGACSRSWLLHALCGALVRWLGLPCLCSRSSCSVCSW